jgi:hypothetical protein
MTKELLSALAISLGSSRNGSRNSRFNTPTAGLPRFLFHSFNRGVRDIIRKGSKVAYTLEKLVRLHISPGGESGAVLDQGWRYFMRLTPLPGVFALLASWCGLG